MTTIALNRPAHQAQPIKLQLRNPNIWNKGLALADAQSHNKTLWFIVSLIVQGVLFLPIPAVVIYYYNAPVIILVITLTLFFSNIIAGMSGSGIRMLLFLFISSVIVHLVMLALFII